MDLSPAGPLDLNSARCVADRELRAAREVLAAYDLDPQACRIEQPTDARGFSGALVLRVEAGERCYCLRRWPAVGLPKARLHELHRFVRHLCECGIEQVAVPVVSQTGQSLVERAGRLWQLEPWMPGQGEVHRRPSDLRLCATMQTLARVHLAAQAYGCTPSGREWFACQESAPSPAVRERLSIVRGWSSDRQSHAAARLNVESPSEFRRLASDVLQMFSMVRKRMESELLELVDVRVRLHPCLRDVWHDHVLFTGDEVTGLIDLSATRTENVAADLSRLLGSLLADDRVRWDAALGEYGRVRPLPSHERQLIAALDRSGIILSGLTWIDRFLDGRLSAADLPRVLPRLEAIRDRLATLV